MPEQRIPGVGPDSIQPLTPRTWPLFEDLFGPGGVQGGCWCAYFRMTSRAFEQSSPAEHRGLLRGLVDEGRPVGLIVVTDGRPAGWVAVAPRADCLRLATSAVARSPASDVSGTWAVTCFYIAPRSRGTGLMAALLDAAVHYAAEHRARSIEGYPVDSAGAQIRPGKLYHGELQTFLAAGFQFLDRRGRRRALVRRDLSGPI